MTSSVVLTVAGNVDTAEVAADPTVALAELMPGWAARCSSYPPDDLVVLAGDDTTLCDPGDNLADLGLGYGAVLRLVTGEEAMAVLEVRTVDGAPQIGAVHPLPLSGQGPPPASGTGVNGSSRTPTSTGGHLSTLHPPGPEATNSTLIARHESRVGTTGEPALEGPPEAASPVQSSPAAAKGGGTGLPSRVPATQRITRALKAVFSSTAPPAQQAGTFGKATTPGAGERYRRAMRDSDRGHNLETMIRTATLDRCMVIAVVSPKGGAGKTTVTALLGMLLAELRRDPVLALDANPDFGNLADKLSPPDGARMCTDELARWLAARPAATPAELAARLGTGPHGLRFLPTPVGDLDRMVAAADVALYRDLIARLRDYQGIILVDCGTGLLDPPARAALDTADQILLVTDSSADTAGLVVTAAQYLPAGTPTWLVANKMPARGAMVDLDRVTQAIPQLRGVTVIPEQRLTENILTPTFDWAHGPGPWQEPLREIAARLAATWHTLDRPPGQRLDE